MFDFFQIRSVRFWGKNSRMSLDVNVLVAEKGNVLLDG